MTRLPKRTEYRAVLAPWRGRPNSPCSIISSMGNRLPSGQWTTSGSMRPSSVTRASMPTYCFQGRFAGMCRSLCRMPFIIEHRFVSRNRTRKNGKMGFGYHRDNRYEKSNRKHSTRQRVAGWPPRGPGENRIEGNEILRHRDPDFHALHLPSTARGRSFSFSKANFIRPTIVIEVERYRAISIPP